MSDNGDYEGNGTANDGFLTGDGGVRGGENDDHRDSKSQVWYTYSLILPNLL